MTAAKRDVSYKQLTRQLAGKAELSAEDEAHLRLRVALFGASANHSTAEMSRARRLAALKIFVARYGHARVPQNHVEGDVKLGAAVGKWRVAYKNNTLPTETVTTLEALPGWAWNTKSAAIESNLAALNTFVSRYGHARVPQNHVEGDINLGAVVGRWRVSYRKSTLPTELAATLEALPGWVWDVRVANVERNLAALNAFVAEHGHAGVLIIHVEGDVNLGVAVSGWRVAYGNGTLSAELVATLEALPGWVWDANAAATESNLAALSAFVAEHGHARVPIRHVEGDVNLGAVAAGWRKRYKRGEMPTDLIATLEVLPGWVWSPHAADASRNLAALDLFVAEHGHSRVPNRHVEGDVNLGAAVAGWRRAYKIGKLSAELIVALENLPGWVWDAIEAGASRNLAALDLFVAEHGHARVPNHHVEGDVHLGTVVGNWRRSYNRGTRLSAELIATLEALSGWVWSTRSVS